MERKFKSKILTLMPLCLFLSTDGIFSMQSLLPLLCMTLVYDCVFSNHRIKKDEGVVILVFLLISVLAMATNMIFSPDYLTNQSLIRVAYYGLIIYFYYSMTDLIYLEEDLLMTIYSLIGVGCAISFYFIFVQKIWYVNLIGTRVDKNFVGLFLMLGALFSLCLGLQKKKRIFFILCAVLAVGIFYSASRASMLYFIAVGIITLMMYAKKRIKTKYGTFRILVFGAFVPIVAALFWIFIKSKMLDGSVDITWYWNRYFVNGFGDESVTGRFVWWKRALGYFLSRPLYGYGIGNINVSGNSSAVAHNTYIDFLLDQGIIGFGIFLAFLKRSICRIFLERKELLYGVVFAVLIGIFNVSATRSVFLWFSLILLHGISNCDKENKNELTKQK